MAITVQTIEMTAVETYRLQLKKRKPNRIYATINNRRVLVIAMKAAPDFITIGIWGDTINALELHQLPLDAKLTVIP